MTPKKLVVRLDPTLHARAKAAAALAGVTLQDWVANLIRQALEKPAKR